MGAVAVIPLRAEQGSSKMLATPRRRKNSPVSHKELAPFGERTERRFD
jgi:hypothetical protein